MGKSKSAAGKSGGARPGKVGNDGPGQAATSFKSAGRAERGRRANAANQQMGIDRPKLKDMSAKERRAEKRARDRDAKAGKPKTGRKARRVGKKPAAGQSTFNFN